jgi:hypothetical protein
MGMEELLKQILLLDEKERRQLVKQIESSLSMKGERPHFKSNDFLPGQTLLIDIRQKHFEERSILFQHFDEHIEMIGTC